jgi:nuclear receptor-binding protein
VASPDDEGGSDEDSDEDILETGQNGRYQKMIEQVPRDVPGIDAAHLAMDTEDGVEVVWNEVRYSSRKSVSASKEVLVKILKRLTDMQHPNIVNFMDFWHDQVLNQDRLVFITEHMTSGSLLLFLLKAKRPGKSVSDKMFRRWCRQILSALSYLHKNEIVHGNLSLASIFIQHNGAVKIGSVSPDAIHQHVKTKQLENRARLHYTAPEYAGNAPITTSADIYSFGICALEMLNLDLLGAGEASRSIVKKDVIDNVLANLRPERRQQFIRMCLSEDPSIRPRASQLLKNPVLQEVFELKVLSALSLRRLKGLRREDIEAHIDIMGYSHREKEDVLAEAGNQSNWEGLSRSTWKVAKVPPMDWEKFLEEIELDVVEEPHRPSKSHNPQKEEDSSLADAPRSSGSASERNSMQYDPETRLIEQISGEIRGANDKRELCLQIRFTDKMQRGLKTEVKAGDDGDALTMDLIFNGLICEDDKERVSDCIQGILVTVA